MQCKASGSVSLLLPVGKATRGSCHSHHVGVGVGQSWLDWSTTNPMREEVILQCGQSGVHCLGFLPECFLFNRVDITPEHRQENPLCGACSTVLCFRDREDTVLAF